MSSPYNLRSRGLLVSGTSVPRRPISSRPPKRQCLPKSVPSSSSYLDRLPREALENVLRHVSKRPRLLYWKRVISTRDIFALYRCGGSLTAICKELFTAVSIGEWYRNNDELMISKMNDFLILLDIAGSSLEKLTFAELPGHVSARHIGRTLASKCNAVKSLNLHGVRSHVLFNKILEKCSGTLESLSVEVRRQEPIAAMVRHCSGLRALDIDIWNGENELDLSSLWPTVGISLRWLELYDFFSFEDEDIRSIQTHCRALQHVEINGTSTSEAIGDLFVSYGRQLEHVCFIDASPEICRRVVNACPNLSCVVSVSDDMPLVAVALLPSLKAVSPSLRALGPALKELHITEIPRIRSDELSDAMAHCANLKKVWAPFLLESAFRVASGVFSSPKAQLEVLNLGKLLTEDREKILDCIARNTGGLRELSLSLALPQPKSFCGIVQSNALLETVKINLWGEFDVESGAVVSVVVDILESFSSCPNLRYLNVQGYRAINSQDVINACRPFRFKRTSVHVFGNDLFL